MKLSKILGAMVLISTIAVPGVLASGGSSSPTPSISTPEKTPEQQATDHYNRGISIRDRAESLQLKIETMTEGPKRDKTGKKIEKAWKNAIKEFGQAVQKNPMYYQAYSGLGYSFRKAGDYESSLGAYGRALSLEPNYTEAIEYRAEAYLGLNRIDDAKEAYAVLIEQNQIHAAELLEAMKSWVDKRTQDPSGVTVQTVNELDRWIEQQASTMGDTVGHAMPGQVRRW